ncbi:MAG: Ig-like domain-containing protein, partial [Pseudomonadota bacterium]
FTIDVTANDYDLQGDPLTVTEILGQPVSVGDTVPLASGASVLVGANGELTVFGDGVNEANDTFTYTVSDGNGSTSLAFVNVTITAAVPNTAPIAVDDPSASAPVVETVAAADLTGGLSGGVVTVSDASNTLTMQVISGPDPLVDDGVGIGFARNNGASDNTLEIAFASGVETVDLEFGYFNNDEQPVNSDGVEQLSNFQVFDTSGNDITSQVAFSLADNSTQGGLAFETVSSLNGEPNSIVPAGPSGGGDVGSFGENTTGVLSLVSSGPAIGSVPITHKNNNDTRDGANQPFGVVLESVTYATASEGTGPYETDEATVLIVSAADGVIGNDSDPENQPLTVTEVNGESANVGSAVTLASGAIVTLNADGSFDYDPNGAFDGLEITQQGFDTFAYTIADSEGATDTAIVTITINGISTVDTDADGVFDFLDVDDDNDG